LGDLSYAGVSGVETRLPGNTTTTTKFLTSTGNGTVSAAPAYFDLFGSANTWGGNNTFSVSPIVPNATIASQAVAFGQLGNYIDNSTNQTGIAGNKTWTGAATFTSNILLTGAGNIGVHNGTIYSAQEASGFGVFSDLTGTKFTAYRRDQISYISPSSSPLYIAYPSAQSVTATINWPTDKSGTVALTSDISTLDNVLSKTANYTIVSGDFVTGKNSTLDLYVDATNGNVTITMPSAVTFAGYTIYITKTDTSANTVTINTVLGGNTLLSQYQDRQYRSNSTSWYNH
jgi:hypothetical protein